MTMTEKTRERTQQVTMFLEKDLVRRIDRASDEAFNGRRNGRTAWVKQTLTRVLDEADREKAEMADGLADADGARLHEIVRAYRQADEEAREWLRAAARLVTQAAASSAARR